MAMMVQGGQLVGGAAQQPDVAGNITQLLGLAVNKKLQERELSRLEEAQKQSAAATGWDRLMPELKALKKGMGGMSAVAQSASGKALLGGLAQSWSIMSGIPISGDELAAVFAENPSFEEAVGSDIASLFAVGASARAEKQKAPMGVVDILGGGGQGASPVGQPVAAEAPVAAGAQAPAKAQGAPLSERVRGSFQWNPEPVEQLLASDKLTAEERQGIEVPAAIRPQAKPLDQMNLTELTAERDRLAAAVRSAKGYGAQGYMDRLVEANALLRRMRSDPESAMGPPQAPPGAPAPSAPAQPVSAPAVAQPAGANAPAQRRSIEASAGDALARYRAMRDETLPSEFKFYDSKGQVIDENYGGDQPNAMQLAARQAAARMGAIVGGKSPIDAMGPATLAAYNRDAASALLGREGTKVNLMQLGAQGEDSALGRKVDLEIANLNADVQLRIAGLRESADPEQQRVGQALSSAISIIQKQEQTLKDISGTKPGASAKAFNRTRKEWLDPKSRNFNKSYYDATMLMQSYLSQMLGQPGMTQDQAGQVIGGGGAPQVDNYGKAFEAAKKALGM